MSQSRSFAKHTGNGRRARAIVNDTPAVLPRWKPLARLSSREYFVNAAIYISPDRSALQTKNVMSVSS